MLLESVYEALGERIAAVAPVQKKQPIDFNGAPIRDGITRIVNGLEELTLAKPPRRQRETQRDQMAQPVWSQLCLAVWCTPGFPRLAGIWGKSPHFYAAHPPARKRHAA